MTTFPISVLPVWAVVIDYVFGLIMWTLIGRAAFGFFMAEDSPFFFNADICESHRPVDQNVQMGDPVLSGRTVEAALCGMVLLHDPLLSDALADWVIP